MKIYKQRYYQENKIHCQRYYQEHKEEHREYSRRNYQEIRKKAMLTVGRGILECSAGCGCDDMRFLEINHINGGGNKELKNIRGNVNFYRKIYHGEIKTENLNLLCRVCNTRHFCELKAGTTLPYTISFNNKH